MWFCTRREPREACVLAPSLCAIRPGAQSGPASLSRKIAVLVGMEREAAAAEGHQAALPSSGRVQTSLAGVRWGGRWDQRCGSGSGRPPGRTGRADRRPWFWDRGDGNSQVSSVWPQELPQACDVLGPKARRP